MSETFAVHKVRFDLGTLLKARVMQDALDGTVDELFAVSPSPSPTTLTPQDSKHVERAAETSTVMTAQERLKRRRTLQSRNNRSKRQRREKEYERDGPPIREKAEEKHSNTSTVIFTTATVAQSHVARTGYIAINKCPEADKEYGLKELMSMGFDFLKWDGRTRVLIADTNGYVVGILGGMPDDKHWEQVNRDAQEHLSKANHRLSKLNGEGTHRRGRFPTLRCGVSYGGGQPRPMNAHNDGIKGEVLNELNSHRCFQRFASYGSSVFQSCAPRLHEYYASKLGSLFEHDTLLKKPFNSIFTAATYNLGPQVVCFPHVDQANLSFGFCAITAIGDFDASSGGHLVLWDCKLAIQFPPGSTALILSGVLTHSNSRVAAEETRFSFTQYCAGGLFRWVDVGFQTVASFRASISKEESKAQDAQTANHWEFGLNLLPKLPWISSR